MNSPCATLSARCSRATSRVLELARAPRQSHRKRQSTRPIARSPVRVQSVTQIHITLRPQRRRRTAGFVVFSYRGSAFAIEVSTQASFVGDQSFSRISVDVVSNDRRIIIGQRLHHSIRRAVTEALRGTIGTHHSRLVTGCVVFVRKRSH
jgi:hypothetical protein